MNKLSTITKNINIIIRLLSGAIIISMLFILIPQNKVGASPAVGFNAGKIIDDSVFINSNSMNVIQIQSFLNSKVPSCDTNGSQPATEYGRSDITHAQYAAASGWSAPPYVCLKNYSENGLSSAQIIYNISQQYNINPQVLIVLLQKEQGLVTDAWPLTAQYKTATGYGCPDTAACDTQYYGFTNQLTWSAKMFRAIMDNNPNWYTPYILGNNYIQWNPNSSCGGSVVNIQNRSTQALYNYTPYQPNQAALNAGYGIGDSCGAYGNRNFYLYFTDWFGSTTGSFLLRSETNGAIYAISDNKKYYIPSWEVLLYYGYSKYPIYTVSENILTNYNMDGNLTSMAKKQYDPSGTIYFFDDGKRYPIDINSCKYLTNGSVNTNTSWGLDCFNESEVVTLPNELIDKYTAEDIILPNIIINDNKVWMIENAKKRAITSEYFINVFGGWNKVRAMQNSHAIQSEGKLLIPDGSTVKFDNNPTIYFLSDGLLHPSPGMDEYKAWNLSKRPYFYLPASANNSDPLDIGEPLKFCAKDQNDNYYLITLDNNRILQSGTPNNWIITPDTCNVISNAALYPIPIVSNTGVYRSSNGNLFTSADKKEFIFPTLDDFYNMGNLASRLINVTEDIEKNLSYGGFHLTESRLFKVNGYDTIRYVKGANSLIVNFTNYPKLSYDKLIIVDTQTSLRYPINGTYQP